MKNKLLLVALTFGGLLVMALSALPVEAANPLISGRAFFKDQFGQVIYLQDVKVTQTWVSGSRCSGVTSLRREVPTSNVNSTHYCTRSSGTCSIGATGTTDCRLVGTPGINIEELDPSQEGSCVVNDSTKTVDENGNISTSTNYVYVFPQKSCFYGGSATYYITANFLPDAQTYTWLPIVPQNADGTWNGYWRADTSRLQPLGQATSFSWDQTNQRLSVTGLTGDEYYNVDFEWIYYPSVYTPAASSDPVSSTLSSRGRIYGYVNWVAGDTQCVPSPRANGYTVGMFAYDPNSPCTSPSIYTRTYCDLNTPPSGAYQFDFLPSGWNYTVRLIPEYYLYRNTDSCGNTTVELLISQTCGNVASDLSCGGVDLEDYTLSPNESKQHNFSGKPAPPHGYITGTISRRADYANTCSSLNRSMSNVLVKLVGKAADGTDVTAYTFSDNNGDYVFNQVPYGNYVPYVDLLTVSAVHPVTGVVTTNRAVSPDKFDYILNCLNCGASQEKSVTLSSSNPTATVDYGLWRSNANCIPGTIGCGAEYGAQAESTWLRTQSGNIHSIGGFSVTGVSGGIFASDTVSGGGSVANGLWSFTPADYTISNRNWRVQSYSDQNVGSFDTFFSRYIGKTRTSPTNDDITDATGVFNSGWINGRGNVIHIQATSDVRITSPLAINANQWTSVFVEGPDPALFDLYIDKDITIPQNSGVVFIVKGSIKIGKDVANMDGVFVARQTIYDPDPDANQASTVQLTGQGGLIGWNGLNFGTPTLNRKPVVSGDITTSPAYNFSLPPKYFVKFGSVIGDSNYTWKEVAP